MPLNKFYEQVLTKDLLEELYIEKHMSFRQIATETKTTYDAVKSRVHRFNIPVRSNSDGRQKYKINQSYFDKIDTCQKAYYLGLMIADGWVSKTGDVGITLSTKDEEIIIGFKKELESEHPIKRKEQVGKYTTFTFKNKRIWEKLNEYGCIPNKSLTVNLKDVAQRANILGNKELISCLLLGYFDGDGGFTRWQHPNGTTVQYEMNVTGTNETCQFFEENILAHSHYKARFPERNNNNTTLRFSGRNVCKAAANVLYSHIDKLSYYLKRKYNVYKEL